MGIFIIETGGFNHCRCDWFPTIKANLEERSMALSDDCADCSAEKLASIGQSRSDGKRGSVIISLASDVKVQEVRL